ncbi:hypothetical protein [Streptomyces sp. NPDC008150]|uniref:hypothetical protein n=1 Tax=Streptomyces sp. NPDC008150 TaxID=3364816 RepID=UPI0036EDA729
MSYDWNTCKHCGGWGCEHCGQPTSKRKSKSGLSGCGEWIVIFIIAAVLAPVIMGKWGNPLDSFFHWLGNLKAPGSH